MAEVTRRLSTQEWDELIENYHTSGLTSAQWCGFKVSQLRWQISILIVNYFSSILWSEDNMVFTHPFCMC
jgi:hypothetical protein